MIVDTVWLTLSQYIVTFFRAVAAARRLSSVGSYFCTWAGVNGARRRAAADAKVDPRSLDQLISGPPALRSAMVLFVISP